MTKFNNAVAKNIDIGSGKKERYILYDNNFFNKIDVNAGTDWAATSVLAHEIGHHLNGHALNDEGSNHKWELEADEFSGFVMARMGATLDDAQSAIQTLKYEKATSTHPAKADRLLAIEKGYNRGLGKTIVVKKIDDEIIKNITENNEDVYIAVDGITTEQVFFKYIDAIGGEDKVRDIKTLTKKNSLYVGKDGKKNKVYLTSETFLTPNSFIYEISGGEYYNGRTLWIDGNSYKKNGRDLWQKGTQQILTKKLVSYIPEYSMLITKKEAVFLGIKTIEGVSCFAIEMPNTETIINTESYMSRSIFSYINYYSIDSGLLVFTKNTVFNNLDWFKNTDSQKDRKTTTQSMTSYLDYRPVNGVLFPFRTESKIMDSEGGIKSTSINEYEDIQVNPIINKEDFRVKK